jgi:hypothetical protein
MTEQWMSIVEYARAFSISDMTVRRRIKNGKLHAVLRDGKYFIPVTEQGAAASASLADRPAMTPEPAMVSSPNVNEDTRGFAEPSVTAQPSQTPAPPAPTTAPKAAAWHDRSRLAEYHQTADASSASGALRHIPDSLQQRFQDQPQSVVDTRALLQFCESSLNRMGTIEKHVNETYRAKMQVLEERVKAKDLEISRLKQQVEDLQTLVNMMESPVKPK